MKILLATDGSANADAALEVVLYRSWEKGTTVHVISVLPPVHDKINHVVGLFGMDKVASIARAKYKEHTNGMLERYAEKLKNKFGQQNVTSAVLEGRIKETIVAEGKKFRADSIILGVHTRRDAESIFGNVADYVLSHANCSVEILRSASLSTMLKEIERQQPIEEDKYLVALDDSDCSEATVNHILSRQWTEKPFFKIISVVEPLPFQAYSGLGPWEGSGSEEYIKLVNKTMEAEQAVAKKVVADAATRIKEKFRDAEVSVEVLEGYARDQILSAAKTWPADLIIMGSHGRGGFMEFVLGSVSKATATHAPCSVLVVRSHASYKAK